jgi:hypothetical protein
MIDQALASSGRAIPEPKCAGLRRRERCQLLAIPEVMFTVWFAVTYGIAPAVLMLAFGLALVWDYSAWREDEPSALLSREPKPTGAAKP